MATREEIVDLLTSPGGICEIEQREVNGVLLKTWKHAPGSMAELVEASRKHGDKDFIIYQDERLTFEHHYQRVASLAHTLINDYGVRKGDRIAIASRNYPEWIVAFWAVTSVGAVVVPINAWWTSSEMEYGLADSGARIVIADQRRLERLLEIKSPLAVEHILAVRCDSLPDGVTDLHSCFDAASPDIQLPRVDIQPDDNATLFYTSGTTGFPKGTIGSHRNFCSLAGALGFNGAQMLLRMGGTLEHLPLLQQLPQATMLMVPLFHVAGCHGIMLPMLMGGGKMVMMHKWDPVAALDAIEREKITMLSGVPAMIWQLLQQPDIAQRDLSSLRQLGYGGAPAPPELLRTIKAKAPSAIVTNGWGITETSSAISIITGQDYLDKPDSVGLPLVVCDVKVVDENGETLAPNEMGELWVRGPNVVKGYWNKPEATAESFTDGWFHTGDVGKIDQDGFIYILDRLKDMIIRGGENVYSAEVEAALVEHPLVDAACVFGIPSEALGEEVAAVLVLRPGADLAAQDLQVFVAERLAQFKIPSQIWFRNEALPTGATGKVQKKELKAFYLGLLDRNEK